MAQPLALFSVHSSRRTDLIIQHAYQLLELPEEWEIVATKGTHEFLINNLSNYHGRIHTIEQLFGVSEILGGIFKTLDPRIHAALYATPEQLEEARNDPSNPALKELYRLIDLVYIRLHPLEERVDLGGFALLRTAIEGNRLTVPEPALFDSALSAIQASLRKDYEKEARIRNGLHDATRLSLLRYDLAALNAHRKANAQFALTYNMDY